MRELTIAEVASMFGKKVDMGGKRTFCLLRKHQRRDKTMGVFRGSDGAEMYKCWSCDPPDNAGDALKLYQLLAGVDRLSAWKELRDRGFNVPGATDGYQPRNRPSTPPVRKAIVPIEGRKPTAAAILPLDLSLWRGWQEQRLGAVERFAEMRGLSAEALRRLDVVDIAKDAVGFGYRDPATGLPCRVKVRTIERKSFWIEPRPAEGVSAVALSPLYLAHALQFLPGVLTTMVMTEGEVDALTLRTVGINNVVSLPDGSYSASRVNLDPVWTGTALVLSAVDGDEEGEKAHHDLYMRTQAMHKSIARVRWRRTETEAAHKDANEALLAGFTRDDFMGCLQRAADGAMGFQVPLGQACLATG